MVKLNHHFAKLKEGYLFPEIEKKVDDYRKKNSNCKIIDLGIGDITQPLPKTAVSALAEAALEMGSPASFRGYGPPEGYLFLRDAIQKMEYAGLSIQAHEIFVSDGAQSDIANFQELFDQDNRIAIPDPTYPVYLDSNIIAGRTRALLKNGRYGGTTYLVCTEKNGFEPQIPLSSRIDLIYLCSPNNPTGIALDRTRLKTWVDYARRNKSVILFDGAYSAFITNPDAPRSIYEIEGAREVAVEFRTFSKSAGFTGLRCSYTVVPEDLKIYDFGKEHCLHSLWKRRHDTKFNGVAYPVQRAAAALFTEQGQEEVKALVRTYLERTGLLRQGLQNLGYTVYGGKDAPFLWCKTPSNMTSWQFFDFLLEHYQIVSIPGSGFGQSGEGFVRFSGFANPATLQMALQRLQEDQCALH
ncbi:MAG TPA: LL-diaminopimelate aminotransferase [Chlamydiales bacterium]|nr:LL-diaminopimelate aminotransferase [Chlamydiales bacterium]